MKSKARSTVAKPSAEPVERSFDGIRAVLFREFDTLLSGKTSIARANAVARLALALNGVTATQLAVAKYAEKNKGGELPRLALA